MRQRRRCGPVDSVVLAADSLDTGAIAQPALALHPDFIRGHVDLDNSASIGKPARAWRMAAPLPVIDASL